MNHQNQIDEILNYYQMQVHSRETILQALREIQALYGYIPTQIQNRLAQIFEVKLFFIQALIHHHPVLRGDTAPIQTVTPKNYRVYKAAGWVFEPNHQPNAMQNITLCYQAPDHTPIYETVDNAYSYQIPDLEVTEEGASKAWKGYRQAQQLKQQAIQPHYRHCQYHI